MNGKGEHTIAGTAEFERMFLPHLDAAYNLARMVMRSPEDAEDVVQEAFLKAYQAFHGFRGDSPRPWLLTITRNTAFTWLRDNRARADSVRYNDSLHESASPDPEAQTLAGERARGVEDCIDALPAEYREVIVLREWEDLPYRDIAGITGVPLGTVMSRLSRARIRISECLKGGGRR